MDREPWTTVALPPMIKIEMSDTVTLDPDHRPGSKNVTPDLPNTTESTAGQQSLTAAQTAPILRLPEEVIGIIIFLAMERSGYKSIKLKNTTRRTHRWQRELYGLRFESSMCFMEEFPKRQPPKNSLNTGPLRLLLVCKTFYFAGVQQYYGSNTIHFDTAQELVDFANDLGSDRRQYVRHVRVDMFWDTSSRSKVRSTWLSIYHDPQTWSSIRLPEDYALLCSEHLRHSFPRLLEVTIDFRKRATSAYAPRSVNDGIKFKIFEALARKQFMGRQCEFKLGVDGFAQLAAVIVNIFNA